ncbi:MAG: esterase-like activity of phytase family protein [Betaproteobacteria bacterium]|nr:MAG: esterase-like activity of phytase family protein [Betaproteobacteria bacterium]
MGWSALVKRLLVSLLLGAAAWLVGCTATPTQQASSTSEVALRFISESSLPHRLEVFGTTFGGISGCDYDAKRGVFYLLSDDRSDINAARFYTAKLTISASDIGKPELLSVSTLKKANGSTFGNKVDDPKNVLDPEAIRYRADTDTLIWTSEGDRRLLVHPTLAEMRLDGTMLRTIPTLSMFNMNSAPLGSRDNNSFEGLSLSVDGKSAWVAMEAPIYEDGEPPSVTSAGGAIRFTQYDLTSAKALRQIAYRADAIPARPMPPSGYADNGVPEVLLLDEHRMLVLERSFAQGIGNSIRIYLIDTRTGSDTMNIAALTEGNFRSAPKKLLVNFDSLNLRRLDNTEAMCFGPRLPNGNRTLVVASDDNFNARQVNQFLAFELIEK